MTGVLITAETFNLNRLFKKMKYTQKGLSETTTLDLLLKKIDNIDAIYVNTITDDINNKQPFFLSVLLGYNLDITPVELEELMKIYFLIWEYFKDNQNVQTRKITEQQFETIQDRNIAMLQYAEGENAEQRKAIYGRDLQNLKSKDLLMAVFFCFDNRSTLINMNSQTKGIIIIGIKSFIECFETV